MNFVAEDDKWKVNEDETVVFGSKHFHVRNKYQSFKLWTLHELPSVFVVLRYLNPYLDIPECMRENFKMWTKKGNIVVEKNQCKKNTYVA